MNRTSDHRLALLFGLRRHLPKPLGDFIVAEAAGAAVLLIATAIALLWANLPAFGDYTQIWSGSRTFINEGLMAVFFLVVGLEIKREFVKGELRGWRAALLPILAAAGGMVVPALIYLGVTAGGPGSSGWAIPMATDIVFAAAVLTLLSKHVPRALKLFLLVLAIVDDIGAIGVIGIFYSGDINGAYLAGAVGVIALMLWWRRLSSFGVVSTLGLVALMWACLHGAGVQASIAGAIIGLFAPFEGSRFGGLSVGERIETLLYPFATFVVVPIFALANAGVAFTGATFSTPEALSVGLGVFAGLLFGKVLGITGASWLAIRLGWARLPDGTNWQHMMGMACVAGIGFTVALFVADLSFGADPGLLNAAKVSILATSAIAAGIGYLFLRSAHE